MKASFAELRSMDADEVLSLALCCLQRQAASLQHAINLASLPAEMIGGGSAIYESLLRVACAWSGVPVPSMSGVVQAKQKSGKWDTIAKRTPEQEAAIEAEMRRIEQEVIADNPWYADDAWLDSMQSRYGGAMTQRADWSRFGIHIPGGSLSQGVHVL